MAIVDILVHVDAAASFASRAALAVDLARRTDAHLIGLGVKPPMPTMLAADGGAYAVLAELEAIAAQAMVEAKERFDVAMRDAGLADRAEWRTREGDLVTALALHGRYTDLTVVSQGDAARDPGDVVAMPGDLAIAGGRPVLVVPHVGAALPFGRQPLVAWNGSREAARAVADALPLLRLAQQVVIVTITERGAREPSGQDLARHLARHRVQAEVEATVAGELRPGELLLNIAMERGSDLLVMGCYGHSRLREAILGGATRELLRSMTLPVLLCH